jgi:hypothetical protein
MTSAEYLIKSVKEYFNSQHSLKMQTEFVATNSKINLAIDKGKTSQPILGIEGSIPSADNNPKIELYGFPKKKEKSKKKKLNRRRR